MLQPAVLPYNEYRKFGVKDGENDLICAKTKNTGTQKTQMQYLQGLT